MGYLNSIKFNPCQPVKNRGLTPGTCLKPHCGPTNLHLTCHLGLEAGWEKGSTLQESLGSKGSFQIIPMATICFVMRQDALGEMKVMFLAFKTRPCPTTTWTLQSTLMSHMTPQHPLSTFAQGATLLHYKMMMKHATIASFKFSLTTGTTLNHWCLKWVETQHLQIIPSFRQRIYRYMVLASEISGRSSDLPLQVPPGCRIRVGREWRSWHPGRCLVFDDSYEHEVRWFFVACWLESTCLQSKILMDVFF